MWNNTPAVLSCCFSYKCLVTWSYEKPLSVRHCEPRFNAAFWDYMATCVSRGLLSKATSQRSKKTPKHKAIYWDKFRAGREIFLLALRQMVGVVGAVHGWSGGGTAGPLLTDRMVHSVRSLQEAQHQTQAHTHTHPPSLTHTRLAARTWTHTKTITFLCFYECFINHVNGSQSYTPEHNYSLHSHTQKNIPLFFLTLTHLFTRWHSRGGIPGLLYPPTCLLVRSHCLNPDEKCESPVAGDL